MSRSFSRISRWTITLLVLCALVAAVLPAPIARATGIRPIQPAATSTASITRVSPTGSTTWPCGTSWGATCTLQTALTGAASSDEILVAAGTYKPTAGSDRAATFQLKSGVAVYGGFAGSETARDQRDITANVTILSGDIGTLGNNSDNSYHVVMGANTAVLDGFTVTGGNANGAPAPNDRGGGMFNDHSSPTLTNIIFSGNAAQYGGGMFNDHSNPALMNVTFSANSASSDGGGIYNGGGSPTLTNVTFSANSAGHDGGGMFNGLSASTLTNVTFNGNSATNYGGGMENWTSNPTLTGVTFSANSAGIGGGMYNTGSSPTLTNVTFSGNLATTWGGGMYNDSSSPTLTNVTFSGNSATYYDGGGMFNGLSSPTLTNVTFSGNSATNGNGGGMYNDRSSSTIRNTILWNNSATQGAQVYNALSTPTPAISDSVVQGGCPSGSTCSNIVTANPRLGALGNYGGGTQTVALLPGSSAINAGNDTVCPSTDQRGVARPQSTHCDIGAYEYEPGVLYASPTATGTGDCSSWANACTLQTALTGATAGDEIWVGAGVHKPTTGTDRTVSFQLKSGVSVYGGFAMTETLRSQRNIAAHLTILSGDLDNNDTNLDGNFIAETWANLQGTNAYHVLTLDGVSGLPITGTTVVDGFTITAGNANSNSAPNERGGGLYCKGSGAGHACSPTLTNLTFSGNQAYASGSAATYGGGLFADGSSGGVSSPALTNVTFASNRAYSTEADTFGGALYSQGAGGTSSPILNTVIFTGNQAYGADNFSNPYGGAMYNNGNAGVSSPVLTNVTFINNQAASGMGEFTYGGGMSNNGNNGGVSSPRLTQVSFIGNQALYGGALYNEGLGGTNTPLLVNVTFRGNRAPVGMGGGMYNEASSPTLINVLFSGNRADVSGGGMVNSNATLPTQPRLFNVTFSGNTASFGGAIYNGGGSGTCVVTLVNSILWGNTANNAGPQIYNESANSTANLAYTTLEGSCPSGATCGTGMVYTNPLFIAPVAVSAAPTTLGDYHLQFGSPAIDAGNTLSVTAVTDLDGKARIVNSVVDLGAYESDYLLLTVERTGTGDGNVTSLPAGINCGLSCTYGFQPNSVVTLTATPFLSSTFVGWSGGVLAMTNPVTVLMATAKNVTATFTLNTYSITPTATANGSLTPGTPQTVNYGANLTFTIAPNTGYHILDVGIDGASIGAMSAYTFTDITANHTITATFMPNPYTLTVAIAGNGSGIVTPTVGLHPYLYGDAVTLQATANTGSTFTGWSGDSDCLDGAVTINGDLACTATFTLNPYTLTVTTVGNGSGIVTPTVGLHPYLYGDAVTLQATANTGSTFMGWSGDSDCTDGAVTINGNLACTATFNLITYTLNTNTIGNGHGSIGLTPPGGIYDYGTVVTVTASANVGSFFDGWHGAVSGGANPVTLTIDSNQAITATFNLITYTLNTNTIGTGTGTIGLTPPGGIYDYGTVVTITAVPITGSLFAGWGGACTGTSTCVVTMTQHQAVTATFNLISTCEPVGGAGFTLTPLTPRVGQNVAFTGSVISGTTPITYTWGWGDNTAADSGANMPHTFPLTNTTQIYTVTLNVSNACSGPISVVQPVTVQPWRIYLPLIQK